MNKIKEFMINFLRARNITYYIALGFAVVSAIVGIVSGASLAFAGNTVLTILLPILGLVAFIALSLVGQEKTGAAALGLLDFGALVALICGVYAHFLSAVQNQAMSGFNIGAIDGFLMLIASAVLLVVCAVAANVFAWLRLKKKNSDAQPASQAE